MPVKSERQYRNAEFRAKENEFIVEGYATTWERYPLYEYEDRTVYEQFSKEDFAGTKMDDVIFQYNHEGKVFARMSNDTLKLSFDDYGLKVVADLSLTEASRQMYEEIKAGLVTKMSWGFLPAGAPEYDEETSTITWKSGIKKIYDVSAVSIPANDTTEISARSACDGVIMNTLAECKRAKEIEDARKRMIAILEMEGV
jgi:hypothetical protein